ncbi:GerAB/ArcD/ProY family transporter [Paenibacillus hexagrammi]|uniref:Spore germination protein n=1 Tax=Paenibacillus hexagrammi TaxID=2908839 RepID=A0ABY3SKF7_9BACL|nr:GerAB/ArcD/ProY family transporter [Paenibacillus sp. YPD9-1]UJF33958.1 spore germination protein [Paenibacillus sp. YPD9-1]
MNGRLSSMQTFTLLLVCLLATAIIFGTPKQVNDVWLVEIFSLIPAVMLFMMYVILLYADAGKGYYDLLIRAWGKYAGKALVISYSTYFLYIGARNVRDMLELVMTTILRYTPGQVVVVLFVLVVAYAAAGGIQMLGRLSESIVVFILLFFLTISILLLISGSLDPERLLPLFSDGILPELKESVTSTLWFPYGELIVFLVFAPRLGDRRQFRKSGLLAIITAGMILTLSDLIQTAAMGKDYEKFSAFPLLDASRLINVVEFITRMDTLVGLIIIFGVVLKCAVFLYAGAQGLSTVFRKASRSYVVPLALLVGAMSLLVTRNFAEHSEEGLKYVIYVLHIPFQLLIPLCTGLLLKIRKPRKGGRHEPYPIS